MRGIAALLLVALLTCPAAAQQAQEATAIQKSGQSSAPTATTVLLPVTLAGSTEGAGTFKFGGGVAWGTGQRWDMAASLSASIATRGGIADLVSAKVDGTEWEQTTPWDVGPSLTLAYLSSPAEPTPQAGLPDNVRLAMFNVCNEKCASDSAEPFCKQRGETLAHRLFEWIKNVGSKMAPSEFCAAQQAAVTELDKLAEQTEPENADRANRTRKEGRQAAAKRCVLACASDDAGDPFCRKPVVEQERLQLFQNYDRHNLCLEGKRLYDAYQDSIGRVAYPLAQVNLGAALGRQTFRYRAPTDLSAALVAHSDSHWHGRAGLSAFWLPVTENQQTWTVEMLLLGESAWVGSSTTAKWCSPAGDVPRPASPPGTTDPAEVCRESTLGAPAQSQMFAAMARFGMIDSSKGSWRIAAGAGVRFPRRSEQWQQAEVALQLPLYAATTLFPNVDYKGILRLTPTVSVRSVVGGPRDVVVSVELALLGRRRLMSDRFDEL